MCHWIPVCQCPPETHAKHWLASSQCHPTPETHAKHWLASSQCHPTPETHTKHWLASSQCHPPLVLTQVPEPATIVLLGTCVLGLTVIFGSLRRIGQLQVISTRRHGGTEERF
ncbi:MAG: PEP-CTERM sorting domain-containing protein [Pirellulales bacterium]|nr:PEP-CTERM sorting domain-containing protein [Pirellulales bacterium]